jgi:hypothetical protein
MAIALLLAERLAEGADSVRPWKIKANRRGGVIKSSRAVSSVAGIDHDLTGAILAGWLILATLLVSQIVLLIAMDCVNQELASFSRQLALIGRDVAPR